MGWSCGARRSYLNQTGLQTCCFTYKRRPQRLYAKLVKPKFADSSGPKPKFLSIYFEMTSDIVILVEGLGKKYVIGHAIERERYVALRDVLVRGAHNLWRKAADMAHGRAIVGGDAVEEFWA